MGRGYPGVLAPTPGIRPTTPPDGPHPVVARETRAVAKTSRQLPGPPLDPEADARSRKRARVWWIITAVVVVGLLAWVLTTGGESDRGNEITAPRDFCRAADRYEKAVERQHADSQDRLTPEQISRQVALAQVVVDTAPNKVRADAETFLAVLQRAEAAGKEIEATPQERAAVENVNRHFAQGCGIYAREGL